MTWLSHTVTSQGPDIWSPQLKDQGYNDGDGGDEDDDDDEDYMLSDQSHYNHVGVE